MKIVNLNAHIRVQLTPLGVDLYHAYYRRLYSHYPANGPIPLYPALKDDCFWETELWHFAHIMGPWLYNGAQPVTVGTDLEILIA